MSNLWDKVRGFLIHLLGGRHYDYQKALEMNKLGAKLIIPAVVADQRFPKSTLLFSLNLGARLSGEDYTREDIYFLSHFVNQITANLEPAFAG